MKGGDGDGGGALLQTAKLAQLAGGFCALLAVSRVMLLVSLALQVTAVASFRVAVQVHCEAPGGGHLEYRKQRGSGAVAV